MRLTIPRAPADREGTHHGRAADLRPGLAEHSALPAQLAEVTQATADNLQVHMAALELDDEPARQGQRRVPARRRAAPGRGRLRAVAGRWPPPATSPWSATTRQRCSPRRSATPSGALSRPSRSRRACSSGWRSRTSAPGRDGRADGPDQGGGGADGRVRAVDCGSPGPLPLVGRRQTEREGHRAGALQPWARPPASRRPRAQATAPTYFGGAGRNQRIGAEPLLQEFRLGELVGRSISVGPCSRRARGRTACWRSWGTRASRRWPRRKRRAPGGATAGGDWATYGGDLHGIAAPGRRGHHRRRQRRRRSSGRGSPGTPATSRRRRSSPAAACSSTPAATSTRSTSRPATPVWQSTGADTSGTFAVTVVDGRVHVGLNNGGKPKAAAFDVTDGHLLWQSDEIWFGYETTQQASAIVHDGIQVLFTTGPGLRPRRAAGLRAHRRRDRRGPLQVDDDPGGGPRRPATPAAACGARRPSTPRPTTCTSARRTPSRRPRSTRTTTRSSRSTSTAAAPTFGQIVGSFKGTPDSVTGYDNPVCQTRRRHGVGQRRHLRVVADVRPARRRLRRRARRCGATPTGRLLGAATQKSGWLHVFDAETMTRRLGPPAVRDDVVPRRQHRPHRDRRRDALRRRQPRRPVRVRRRRRHRAVAARRSPGVPMKGGNVALANGVVYYVDEPALKAWDAATGEQLWMSALDAGRHASAAASPSPATTSSPTTTARSPPTACPTAAEPMTPSLRTMPRWRARPRARARAALSSLPRARRRRARRRTTSSSPAPTASATTASRRRSAEIQRLAAETQAFTVEVTDDPAALAPATYRAGRRRHPREHDRARRRLVAAHRRSRRPTSSTSSTAAPGSSASTPPPTRAAAGPSTTRCSGRTGSTSIRTSRSRHATTRSAARRSTLNLERLSKNAVCCTRRPRRRTRYRSRAAPRRRSPGARPR